MKLIPNQIRTNYLSASYNLIWYKLGLKFIFKCRGSINSMSLISISKNKPELGFSSIRTEKTILSKINDLKEKDKPKRATPEKVLQSWIIQNAIKNNYILPCGDEIKFITSEMAVYDENKKRIVNDILGFKDGNLYVIELKSDRTMGRLIEQVENLT